jgi:hypothetical protein
MERRQHHLQAITSQLKNKGTIGRKGIQIKLQNRPKNQRGFKGGEEKGSNEGEMCKNVGSKIVPENWAKGGINTGLERLNKFSIDSPVRWEHCGYPVPEMVSDTEHRQCPH